jgi:hypothetical protein
MIRRPKAVANMRRRLAAASAGATEEDNDDGARLFGEMEFDETDAPVAAGMSDDGPAWVAGKELVKKQRSLRKNIAKLRPHQVTEAMAEGILLPHVATTAHDSFAAYVADACCFHCVLPLTLR